MCGRCRKSLQTRSAMMQTSLQALAAMSDVTQMPLQAFSALSAMTPCLSQGLANAFCDGAYAVASVCSDVRRNAELVASACGAVCVIADAIACVCDTIGRCASWRFKQFRDIAAFHERDGCRGNSQCAKSFRPCRSSAGCNNGRVARAIGLTLCFPTEIVKRVRSSGRAWPATRCECVHQNIFATASHAHQFEQRPGKRRNQDEYIAPSDFGHGGVTIQYSDRRARDKESVELPRAAVR